MKLYFAPMNYLSNHVYRHLMLKHGADYVFSELNMPEDAEWERKVKAFPLDLDRTVFQAGIGSQEDLDTAMERLSHAREINLNMGCPHSAMKKRVICSGLLFKKERMGLVCRMLSDACKNRGIIPSVKLRTGTTPGKSEIDDYMDIIMEAGIRKVYIHARTLRHPYEKPADYSGLAKLKESFPEAEIILNGDIDSYAKYRDIAAAYTCDGIMIGRAALLNPFIFDDIKERRVSSAALDRKKVSFIREFLHLSEKNLPFNIARKNLAFLLKCVPSTTGIRKRVNETKEYSQLCDIFDRLVLQI